LEVNLKINLKIMEGVERFRPMPEEEKLKIEKLTPQDLVRDSSEENVRRYIENIIREAEAKDPRITEILEAKPGEAVKRREALMDIMVRTVLQRVDGLKKGYYKSFEEFEAGVMKIFLKTIEKYEKVK